MLVVDLDRAMLYALEGARIEIASRVIVGAPGSPTPQAESVLDHIRFRPTWRPTPEMIRSGRYVDGLRPPGPSNPLGLAAIKFRGGGLVYLHGTNDPALFSRQRRALSNGCVRVEALNDVVGWVLDWSQAEVRAAMYGRQTFDVPTPTIPFRMSADRNDPMLSLLARLSALA
jgi:murein L,D-transpeptidase YcbB/YkuD